MQIILGIIGLMVLVLIWTLIEQKRLITARFTIKSENLPKAFHDTRFVILSDLHNSSFGQNNERLVRRIDELSPEFIIMAGDMVNKRDICYPSNAFTLIEQLAGRYQIYYAYGNHEQSLERLLSAPVYADRKEIGTNWLEYKRLLTQMNVVVLDNKSILHEKNNDKIRISGVSLNKKYFEHGKQAQMEEGYLHALLGNIPDGVFELLIAHSPLYFMDYAQWGADLTISGHMHGGLIRLPFIGGLISPQVLPFPKYDAGLYKEEDNQLLVSRGLGSHSMMPRLFNAPEIVSVVLKQGSNI